MKFTIQHNCINDDCRTIILTDKNRDGVRCPRCEGPVIPKPYIGGIDMANGRDVMGHMKR